ILMYCNDNHGYLPTCANAADGLTTIYYPEDWIHWQGNRNLDDSAIAKYVGRGEKLKNLLRCPADTFEGRKSRYGAQQGPSLYSYNMNGNIGASVKPYGSRPRLKITMWQAPWKKI